MEEGSETRVRFPSAYGPDGVPLDGPRTTAAELAEWIAEERGEASTSEFWPLYRVASEIDGALYAEALRGARAMRSAADLKAHRFCDHDDATSFLERSYGIPAVWMLPFPVRH